MRAGLVTSPDLWPWSAYARTAGLDSSLRFVSSELVLAHFGEGTLEELRNRYIRHVLGGRPDDNECFQGFRSRKRILGDRQFKLSLLGHLPPTAALETTVDEAVVAGVL